MLSVMANYHRNDPSSLSFGSRLRRAEIDATSAKQELAELKQSLPNSKDLKAAAMTADVIKQQRKSAKQMMGRVDVTLEELNTIDPSVLTPMFQEQLRLSKKDAAFRELPMQQQQFQFQDTQAQSRFQNWAASLQQQEFHNNNTLPGEQKPQRAFDIWSARQDSPQGRYERNRKQQQQLQRDSMLRRAEAERTKKAAKPKGIHLGGLKPLDE